MIGFLFASLTAFGQGADTQIIPISDGIIIPPGNAQWTLGSLAKIGANFQRFNPAPVCANEFARAYPNPEYGPKEWEIQFKGTIESNKGIERWPQQVREFIRDKLDNNPLKKEAYYEVEIFVKERQRITPTQFNDFTHCCSLSESNCPGDVYAYETGKLETRVTYFAKKWPWSSDVSLRNQWLILPPLHYVKFTPLLGRDPMKAGDIDLTASPIIDYGDGSPGVLNDSDILVKPNRFPLIANWTLTIEDPGAGLTLVEQSAKQPANAAQTHSLNCRVLSLAEAGACTKRYRLNLSKPINAPRSAKLILKVTSPFSRDSWSIPQGIVLTGQPDSRPSQLSAAIVGGPLIFAADQSQSSKPFETYAQQVPIGVCAPALTGADKISITAINSPPGIDVDPNNACDSNFSMKDSMANLRCASPLVWCRVNISAPCLGTNTCRPGAEKVVLGVSRSNLGPHLSYHVVMGIQIQPNAMKDATAGAVPSMLGSEGATQ